MNLFLQQFDWNNKWQDFFSQFGNIHQIYFFPIVFFFFNLKVISIFLLKNISRFLKCNNIIHQEHSCDIKG